MAEPVDLRSDNTAGVCPEVLRALAAAGAGTAPGYGDDAWTARLHDVVREVFEHDDARVFPVVSGTAANAVGLSAVCPPWGSVLCHETAHIAVHECGATSLLAGGAVLRTLSGSDAQIDPDVLRAALDETAWGDPHQSQPSVLSITCPSDWGTVPTPARVAELAALAREHGLRVHMDGARLANAVVGLGCRPAELTWQAGVDVLSLGMTKNGGLSADVIVCFDPTLGEELVYRLKRAGHTPSKMRFQSAQLLAMLEDGLWLRLAHRANASAARLASGLTGLGVPLAMPVQANMLFPVAGRACIDALAAVGEVAFYELSPGTIRFVTSWATTDAEVDRVVSAVAAVWSEDAPASS